MRKTKRLFKRPAPYADFDTAQWVVRWMTFDDCHEQVPGTQGDILDCVRYMRFAVPPLPGCVNTGEDFSGVGFQLEKLKGDHLWVMVVREAEPPLADCLRVFMLVNDPTHREVAMRKLAAVGLTRVGYGPVVTVS